jgi:hypothetical protein
MTTSLYTNNMLSEANFPAGSARTLGYTAVTGQVDAVVFVVKWFSVYFGHVDASAIASCVLLDMRPKAGIAYPTVASYNSGPFTDPAQSAWYHTELEHVCLPLYDTNTNVLQFANTSVGYLGGAAPSVDVSISGWMLSYNPKFNWLQVTL